MNKYKFLIIFLFLLFFVQYDLLSQTFNDLGSPFITNYVPRDYLANPQNWGVVQDERGVIYMGNTSGILVFDGNNFELIEVKNKSIVRDLALADDGTIYVGGSGEIGYLSINSSGKINYTSLMDLLPKFEKNFNDVYKVLSTSKGIYFITTYKTIHYYKGKIKVFNSNAGSCFGANVYDDIFIINRYRGIFVLQDENLALLPKSDIISGSSGRIMMLPYGDKQILIATEKQGIYIYNLKELYNEDTETFNYYKKNISDTIIKKIPTEIDHFLKKYSLYDATQINDTTYAFATLLNGIVLMNKKGKLLQVINKKSGLNNNTVLGLFKDRNENLIASLNKGFSIIEINTPITLFSEIHGIEGSIYTSKKHQDYLYVGTSAGIFYLKTDTSKHKENIKFKKLNNSKTNCWDLISVGNFLFGSQDKGVVCIHDTVSFHWSNLAEGIFCFAYNPMFENHVFTGSVEGLEVFEISEDKNENPKLINRYIFSEITKTIRKIVSDEDGNMWITTSFDGVYYIEFHSDKVDDYTIKKYNKNKGFAQNNYNYVHFLKDKLFISNTKGIYKYEQEKDTFIIDTSFKKVHFNKLRASSSMFLDKKNQFWLSTGKIGLGSIIICEDGQKDLQSNSLTRIPKTDVNDFFIDEQNIIWISTNDALFRFNSNISQKHDKNFQVLVRQVKAKKDTLIFDGHFYDISSKKNNEFTRFSKTQSKTLIPKLEYENNSLIFKYTATTLQGIDEVLFQYKLKGFEKEWSKWTKETKKEYTNLPEGKYHFLVRAKNIFGKMSEQTSFKFYIKAPWYRNIWSIFVYLFAFVGVFFLTIHFYSNNLKNSNLKLESIIRERNNEISNQQNKISKFYKEVSKKDNFFKKQSEELARVNLILEDKNKKILRQNKDSEENIQYALNIQKAILFRAKEVNNFIKNFIIFKPKNIVSGDFYWFYKLENKIFIALADCTGHGISGAFMSILGERLLKEIIVDKKIKETNFILEELDKNLKKYLKQEETNNNDGMDIALCVLEENKNKDFKLSFTGAKISLLYYQNKKLSTLKADRRYIGGIKTKSQDISFTVQEIILQKNELFFLTTDGFTNQNSQNRSKFGTKKLIKVLQKNVDLPLNEQKIKLEESLSRHQQNSEQRDDITLIGVRI